MYEYEKARLQRVNYAICISFFTNKVMIFVTGKDLKLSKYCIKVAKCLREIRYQSWIFTFITIEEHSILKCIQHHYLTRKFFLKSLFHRILFRSYYSFQLDFRQEAVLGFKFHTKAQSHNHDSFSSNILRASSQKVEFFKRLGLSPYQYWIECIDKNIPLRCLVKIRKKKSLIFSFYNVDLSQRIKNKRRAGSSISF